VSRTALEDWNRPVNSATEACLSAMALLISVMPVALGSITKKLWRK
jgi:hypothetical protein